MTLETVRLDFVARSASLRYPNRFRRLLKRWPPAAQCRNLVGPQNAPKSIPT